MVGFGINFKGIKFTSDVYMHTRSRFMFQTNPKYIYIYIYVWILNNILIQENNGK